MPNWTYQQLKTAIAALSPLPNTYEAIANSINQQTTTIPVDVLSADVEKIIVPTGEYFSIYQLSLQALSGLSPPNAKDQLIGISWNFYKMLDKWPSIQTTNPNVLVSVNTAITILNENSLLSNASVATIKTLFTNQQPLWQPAVTVGDVQTAETQ